MLLLLLLLLLLMLLLCSGCVLAVFLASASAWLRSGFGSAQEASVAPSCWHKSITVKPSRSYGALHTVNRCDGLSSTSPSAGKSDHALMSRPSP